VELEEVLEILTAALEVGIPVIPASAYTSLQLAQRGFVVVDRRGGERELSIEELEYMVAKERGNVQ
jgi:hypothetical protein